MQKLRPKKAITSTPAGQTTIVLVQFTVNISSIRFKIAKQSFERCALKDAVQFCKDNSKEVRKKA